MKNLSQQQEKISPPDDTPEYMWGAWYAALIAAVRNDAIMKWFRDETGCNYRGAMSAIDEMIDRSTGYDYHFVKTFTEWFNKNIWGPME